MRAWREDWQEAFLENLRFTVAQCGHPDVKRAAELSGLNRSLIYRFRHRRTEFRSRWDLIVATYSKRDTKAKNRA